MECRKGTGKPRVDLKEESQKMRFGKRWLECRKVLESPGGSAGKGTGKRWLECHRVPEIDGWSAWKVPESQKRTCRKSARKRVGGPGGYRKAKSGSAGRVPEKDGSRGVMVPESEGSSAGRVAESGGWFGRMSAGKRSLECRKCTRHLG